MPSTCERLERHGFTLIEIIVVIAVVAILASLVSPMVFRNVSDAKMTTVRAQLEIFALALDAYRLDNDRYPTTEEGLKVLVEAPPDDRQQWRGPYIKMLRPDPWRNPYQYRAPGVHHAGSFDLWSRGADGADGGEGDGMDIGNWQE